LAVSSFDPMLVEISRGLSPLRGVEAAQLFELTVREAVRLGTPIMLLSFGTLADDAKIDQFGHSKSQR
jgi:hypothetical protein